jgi:A/G-specific adenine glycosylase
MLQQTQVATVIPYYQRFVASFPTIAALAAAGEEQVLAHWSGLGYYARGRNLHRAAQIVESLHGGKFPCQFEQILALPGIGRSTAAAICALAFQQRHAILDGNVKRVLARYCGISGSPASKPVEQLLWQHAEALLPECDVAAYTQAMMDMGATLCTRSRPRCVSCPVQRGCVAHQTGRVAELPTPRLRKVVPERHATFLLAMHGREILLERRDSTGVWGGLWCMPQLEEGDGTLADYAQRSGWQIDEQVALPVFTHVLTHLDLALSPVVHALPAQSRRDATLQQLWPNGRWVAQDELAQFGLPAPVAKLLQGR